MKFWISTILFLLYLSVYSFIQAANLPPGFTETRLATGLDPTGLSILPDGRILVTIKSGKVLLLKNNEIQPAPFLTLTNIDNLNERGLLGIEADPDFQTNGYIYAYYTYKNPESGTVNNRISRFTATGDEALVTTELPLFDFENLGAGVHNGGGLVFGADGKLYAASGENANPSNSQNLSSTLGKIIRINSDGSIPEDNPFYNVTTGSRRAIYAMGLRNPYKMKVQPGTGIIYINDVGGSSYEEINQLKSGANYGWPGIEGRKQSSQNAPENYQDPVYAYDHTNGSCSITGGTFYNPPVEHFPNEFYGKYFFLDYCAGWIRYLNETTGSGISIFATGINRGLEMTVDNLGNMYYLARGGLGGGSEEDNTSSATGELWKITYTGNGDVKITVQPTDKKVNVGGKATFVVSASGTAPLTYQWNLNGQIIVGATSQSYTTDVLNFSNNGDKISVTVSNNSSSETSAEAILTVVDNTAPVAEILSPVQNYLYTAGITLSFIGSGTDEEDGILGPEAYHWKIDFHHDTHTHPAITSLEGVKSGTFQIPDEGETSDTVWYRIYLTIKDHSGASTTVFKDIHPKKVEISLNTEPIGYPVILDGAEVNTPFKFTSVVGLKRTLEARTFLNNTENQLNFIRWSNDSSAVQTLITPNKDTTLIARYSLATSFFNRENSKPGFSVYPNPAQKSEMLQVKSVDGLEEVKIFTVSGKLVENFPALNSTNLQILTSDLPSGVYILQIRTGRMTYSERLIIK